MLGCLWIVWQLRWHGDSPSHHREHTEVPMLYWQLRITVGDVHVIMGGAPPPPPPPHTQGEKGESLGIPPPYTHPTLITGITSWYYRCSSKKTDACGFIGSCIQHLACFSQPAKSVSHSLVCEAAGLGTRLLSHQTFDTPTLVGQRSHIKRCSTKHKYTSK